MDPPKEGVQQWSPMNGSVVGRKIWKDGAVKILLVCEKGQNMMILLSLNLSKLLFSDFEISQQM